MRDLNNPESKNDFLRGYFDNSATTFTDKAVADTIYDCLITTDANPSSLYKMGLYAENKINQAAQTIALAIGAKDEEIYFTSGGTEANNLAVFGTAYAYKNRNIKIISSAIEHHSVLDSVTALANYGFETAIITPRNDGTFCEETILEQIDDENRPYLFSFMLINNETGVIFDVASLAKKLKSKAKNVIIHCDCVAGFGKIPIDVKKLGVDLITISAHKIHGPKGVGAIYIKRGTKIIPRGFGGKQQKQIRPGTQPTALIAGFCKSVEIAFAGMKENAEKTSKLKKIFLDIALQNPLIIINGNADMSCDYILNISTCKIKSETMLHFLEEKDLYISGGSACSKGAKSHVLHAMKLPKERIDTAVRISFGKYNTPSEVTRLWTEMQNAMKTLAAIY